MHPKFACVGAENFQKRRNVLHRPILRSGSAGNMSRSNPSMPLSRVLLSEYYIAILAVLASFAWVHLRHSGSDVQMPTLPGFTGALLNVGKAPLESFGTWEWRIGAVCAASAAWRIFTATCSMHGAISTALSFAQLFVITMTYLVDMRLCTTYTAACLLAYLLLEQPQVTDPVDVEVLTPITFKEKARDAATAEPGVAYVVFLHAPWSLSSRHAFSTFADLAADYSTERLRFARLDVGEWPHVATQLGVDTAPGSAYLPSVLLFEKGEELMRLPRRGGRTSAQELRKASMVRAFELDMRFATSMHQRRQPKVQGAGSGSGDGAEGKAGQQQGDGGASRHKEE